MNILVTGGLGMIGYSLVSQLLRQNHRVYCVDYVTRAAHLLDSAGINLFYKHKKLTTLLKDKNFTYYDIDIARVASGPLFDKYQKPQTLYSLATILPPIDAMVHLCALPSVAISENNPALFLSINNTTLVNALEAAKTLRTRFLYASSSSVYGNRANEDESCGDLRPMSVYAQSKLQGESLVEFYHRKYSLAALAMRFFTVYGPYNRPDMLTHLVLNSIYRKQQIDIYNNALNMRDFMFVEDLSSIICYLIEKNCIAGFDILNIGAHNPISLEEFIGVFEKNAGMQANKKIIATKREFEPQVTNCNNTKLLKIFQPNFTPVEVGASLTNMNFKNIYMKLPTLTDIV